MPVKLRAAFIQKQRTRAGLQARFDFAWALGKPNTRALRERIDAQREARVR